MVALILSTQPSLKRLQRFLTQTLTENLGLKLLALLISLLLVFLVRFQEESERLIDVEIVPILPEPVTALVMTTDLPKTVRVRIKGPISVVKGLNQSEIPPINIDLGDRHAGTTHYIFVEEAFKELLEQVHSSLQLIRITPESVQIRMERLVSRQLPVRIITYGNLKPGTELVEQSTAAPSSVTVIGPESAMRGLKSVETEDVDIDGLGVGEHSQIVPVRAMNGISIRRNEPVKITTKVRWTPGKRMISGLLVQAQGTALTAEFRPKEVAVALAGPQVDLNALDPAMVMPIVIISEAAAEKPGVFRGDVTVKSLPQNIKVTSIVPAKVRVTLSASGTGKSKK